MPAKVSLAFRVFALKLDTWPRGGAALGQSAEQRGYPAGRCLVTDGGSSGALERGRRELAARLLVTSAHWTKCVIALRLSGQESKSFPVLTHFVRGGQTELKWRYKTRGHQTQKCPRAQSSRALSLSKSGQTRHAVAPVDRTGLDGLDAVVRFAFLQVIEQRDGLMRSNNDQ